MDGEGLVSVSSAVVSVGESSGEWKDDSGQRRRVPGGEELGGRSARGDAWCTGMLDLGVKNRAPSKYCT